MLPIRGVHPIVLTVADPNRSARCCKRLLGAPASRENPTVRWISGGIFLLCFQRPPHQALPNDRFVENRLGLDHVGFAVASQAELHALLAVLKEPGVPTAEIEFDPDGQRGYGCIRDPDNIQVEFYVGD